MADALTSAALDSMALAAKAAEAELDEAIAANDAPAIAAATQRLRELQGSGAGDSGVDWSSFPGSDVDRDLGGLVPASVRAVSGASSGGAAVETAVRAMMSRGDDVHRVRARGWKKH